MRALHPGSCSLPHASPGARPTDGPHRGAPFGAYAGSSLIRQCRAAFPHRTVLARRPSSGPWSTVGEEPRQESYVVADVPGSRRVPPRQRRFRDLSWVAADQADSCLSFVVPLLELILGDLAANERPAPAESRQVTYNPVYWGLRPPTGHTPIRLPPSHLIGVDSLPGSLD